MLPKQNAKLFALCYVLFLWGFTSTILAQGDTWATKNNMPTERAGHASCEVNNIIYVIGGVTLQINPQRSSRDGSLRSFNRYLDQENFYADAKVGSIRLPIEWEDLRQGVEE